MTSFIFFVSRIFRNAKDNHSDEVMNTEEANLDSEQKEQILELFSQGVKHKMRMNFVRQMSKTSSKEIISDYLSDKPNHGTVI